MAQMYRIKDVKKGSVKKEAYGEYQTYALAIEGIGEPVRLSRPVPVAHEPVVGDTIYGSLVENETDGRIWYTLRPEARPPLTKDEIIRSQWAIGQAVQCYIAGGGPSREAYDNIKREAQHFYAMVEEIKGD